MQYQIEPKLAEFTSPIVEQNGNTVRFEDTIIYPGGGGQPQDVAWLTQGDQRFEVIASTPDGTLTLDQPLVAGDAPVMQHIDRAIRQQNCEYHTLLHLIAAIASLAGAKVSSNQITADHARIELQFETAETATQFTEADLTAAIHQAIQANASVSARYVNRAALADESEHVRTLVSLIPVAVTAVRLVKIAGFDEEACAGTHVQSTGEIPEPITLEMHRKGAKKRRLKVFLPDLGVKK